MPTTHKLLELVPSSEEFDPPVYVWFPLKIKHESSPSASDLEACFVDLRFNCWFRGLKQVEETRCLRLSTWTHLL